MSPVSATISIVATGANAQTATMVAPTTMKTMLTSSMVTIIQRQAAPSPTTVLPPAPEAAPGAAPSPTPFVSEPYASAISFFSSITTILYFFGYLIPFVIIGMYTLSRRAKKRREKLAKKRAEREEKREQVVEKWEKDVEMAETRAYRIHQMQDSERQVNAQILTWEESKRMRENMERMRENMERMRESMERMVTAVQGLERVFRVGLDGVETRTRGIEYRVDWMLDYHLDENERIHALKAILPGLLKNDDCTSTASPSTSWNGDLVENRLIVDEGDWEDHQKPWETQ